MRCGRLSDMATPRVPDRQDSPGGTVAEDQGLPIAHAGSIALTMTIVLGAGRTRQASYPDSAGQTSRSDRSLTASGQDPLPPRHQPWPTNRAAALRSHTATSGLTCNVSCHPYNAEYLPSAAALTPWLRAYRLSSSGRLARVVEPIHRTGIRRSYQLADRSGWATAHGIAIGT
jgi:hypothetical protein